MPVFTLAEEVDFVARFEFLPFLQTGYEKYSLIMAACSWLKACYWWEGRAVIVF